MFQSKRGLPDLGFFAVFIAVWIFLFWKCRYGFANIDESFYLTVPYRFAQGDALLAQEWHLSQTAFLLLLPAMRLHLLLFGGTTGILLHFRWLFTAVWGLAALFFYLRLRPISRLGAMAASLVFMLYAPFGIMALSYNSMGILLLLITGVLLATARTRLRLQHFLAGVSLAGAVLCSPLLLSLYLLFSAVALFAFIHDKKTPLAPCWLYVSLGSWLCALLFCVKLFSGVSLERLSALFPLLLDDPDHVLYGPAAATLNYLRYIFRANRLFPLLLPVAVLILALGRLRRASGWGFVGAALIAAAMLLGFRFAGRWYINLIMFPLNLMGLYCALNSRDEQLRRLFWWVWLPGGLYSYCINFTSNQEFYAISCAGTVMTVASACMTVRFAALALQAKDQKPLLRRCLCGAAAALLLLQLGSELSLRYSSIFWDSDMRAQTAMAQDGPEKGILTRPERLAAYELLREETAPLRESAAIRKVLFISEQTWLYLSTEKESSTFSAWLSGINETCLARLDAYYALFPEKLPDGIYVEARYLELASHFEAMGYQAQPTAAGGCILTRSAS